MGAGLPLLYSVICQKSVAYDLVRQVFVLFRQISDVSAPLIGVLIEQLQLACQGELVALLV
jgi:hypothetical protein